MGTPRTFLLAVLLLLVGVVFSQEHCDYAKDCGDCIQLPGCFWCSELKTGGVDVSGKHCFRNTTAAIDRCKPGEIENPQNVKVLMRDVPLSETEKNKKKQPKTDNIVQLRPQHMKLKLRKGVSEKIEVKYRRAYGYPIDLYYLMDLSNSMKDDKEQLAKLGGELTAALQDLTYFYRIGFGSFVDKVLMPFVDTHPDKIDSPCRNCAKAYSFRNDLPLQNNSDEFVTKVEEALISGNLDSPEGGFDALMQAIVCKEKIGWRDQARRIIVFSTDAQFHQAGDGKLAGVVIPNDERCHLNGKNEYDAYAQYDYPSVGQINKVTKENDIYVIFAVSGYLDLYEKLSKVIENSSYGKLAKDSNNVVELVRDQYNAITSYVSLSDNSSDIISIDYSSKCKEKNGPTLHTSRCSGIREGDEVSFTLDVKLNSCPKDKSERSEIVEVKALQDTLILDVEFECDCNCDKPTDVKSDLCNGKGSLVCGICSCSSEYRGDTCQCMADGSGEQGKDISQCMAHANDTQPCSGMGHCICGECKCDDDFEGKFCHCNTRKCRSVEGEECSNRGTCSCEQCLCNSGFTGPTCECETEDACRMPDQQEVCSGHGHCDCGKCICMSQNETSYSGQYCEDCLTCKGGKCSEFNECVLEKFHDPTSQLCNQTVFYVDSLEEEEDRGGRRCTVVDESDDCMIHFTYRYVEDSKSYEINIQKEKDCPEEPPIMGIVFGILAGIVLIGLLTLLIWKILTTMYDRREYAKFEDERRNAQWNTEGNPLYKDPSNTFANPVFDQQKK